MSEETVVAESSAPAVETPAAQPEAPETFAIPRSGTPEYELWRKDGSLPTKKEEAAPSQKSESAGESETPQKTQEKKKQTADERIAQLEATIEKIRKGAEKKETPKVESSPTKPEPQSTFREVKPKPDDKNADGTLKFNEYEDFIDALGDWKVAKALHERDENAARQAQASTLNSKVEEAKARYVDFADKVAPFVDEFVSDPSISPVVKQMVDDSEVFADLAYVLSGDNKFKEVAKNPGNAIRYIANVERLIAEELAGKTEAVRNDKGQFEPKVETPVKRGPESAPKPPIEIGQRGTSTMDEVERALQEIGRGNSAKATRAWLDAENRKEIARRRGA